MFSFGSRVGGREEIFSSKCLDRWFLTCDRSVFINPMPDNQDSACRIEINHYTGWEMDGICIQLKRQTLQKHDLEFNKNMNPTRLKHFKILCNYNVYIALNTETKL